MVPRICSLEGTTWVLPSQGHPPLYRAPRCVGMQESSGKGSSLPLTLSHSKKQQQPTSASSQPAGSTRDFPGEQLQAGTGLLHPCPGALPRSICSLRWSEDQDAEPGLKDELGVLEFPGAGAGLRAEVQPRPWSWGRLTSGSGSPRAKLGLVPRPSSRLQMGAVTFPAFPFPLRAIISISEVSKVLAEQCVELLAGSFPLMHKCCYPRAALCLMQPALPSSLTFCSPSVP